MRTEAFSKLPRPSVDTHFRDGRAGPRLHETGERHGDDGWASHRRAWQLHNLLASYKVRGKILPCPPAVSCRGKFLTKGSRPRPGGRATPLTLAHHHKPFGSGRIARSPHGLDLAGACARLVAVAAPTRVSPRIGD